MIVGNSAVGKTALCRKLYDGVFENAIPPTIGVSYHHISDFGLCEVAVWDTAGAERFHNIISNYFNQGTVVLVAFSLHRPSTLNMVLQWIRRVRTLNKTCSIVVVGCKSDLRIMDKDTVLQTLHGVVTDGNYIECSAKLESMEELRARFFSHLPSVETFEIEEHTKKNKTSRKIEREYYCLGGWCGLQ